MSIRSGLAAAALALGAGAAFGGEPVPAAAIGRVMQQARTPPVALDALPPAERAARLAERTRLLQQGEAALARLEVDPALLALDRAAAIAHAADTEMALVRAYMQNGEYRRAVAFVAHTAAAHREVAGGAALYAWLLNAGGHGENALRLLSEAEQRFPDDPLLREVRVQLKSRQPAAGASLLIPPARLAPYAQPGPPASARMLANGVLVGDGGRVLTRLGTAAGTRLWVRNGLGHASSASVERRLGDGIVVLRLSTPLPMRPLEAAARDPFPGSVGYVIEYTPARGAPPAWPVLTAGFVGGVVQSPTPRPASDKSAGALRLLGVDVPKGPRGGPVFDAAGRLAGIAVPGTSDAPDRLVPVSHLQPSMGRASAAVDPGAPAKLPADEIYENALRTTVQVLAAD
jgi:hypothetical protein